MLQYKQGICNDSADNFHLHINNWYLVYFRINKEAIHFKGLKGCIQQCLLLHDTAIESSRPEHNATMTIMSCCYYPPLLYIQV